VVRSGSPHARAAIDSYAFAPRRPLEQRLIQNPGCLGRLLRGRASCTTTRVRVHARVDAGQVLPVALRRGNDFGSAGESAESVLASADPSDRSTARAGIPFRVPRPLVPYETWAMEEGGLRRRLHVKERSHRRTVARSSECARQSRQGRSLARSSISASHRPSP
jgi:hypothetical protein